jgi:hypothetical protein
VGLLAQGLTNPQGPDWAETAMEGIEMLLKGIEKE